jgi:hypothetical protein
MPDTIELDPSLIAKRLSLTEIPVIDIAQYRVFLYRQSWRAGRAGRARVCAGQAVF